MLAEEAPDRVTVILAVIGAVGFGFLFVTFASVVAASALAVILRRIDWI
jgi:hypothetical protein